MVCRQDVQNNEETIFNFDSFYFKERIPIGDDSAFLSKRIYLLIEKEINEEQIELKSENYVGFLARSKEENKFFKYDAEDKREKKKQIDKLKKNLLMFKQIEKVNDIIIDDEKLKDAISKADDYCLDFLGSALNDKLTIVSDDLFIVSMSDYLKIKRCSYLDYAYYYSNGSEYLDVLKNVCNLNRYIVMNELLYVRLQKISLLMDENEFYKKMKTVYFLEESTLVNKDEIVEYNMICLQKYLKENQHTDKLFIVLVSLLQLFIERKKDL